MAELSNINNFCDNCHYKLHDVKSPKSPIYTQFGKFNYQCQNCYNVTNGDKSIYLTNALKYVDNFTECQICYEISNEWSAFECNHIMCDKCFKNLKKVDDEFECPFCRKIIKNITQINTKYYYSIIPDKLKPNFMKLFSNTIKKERGNYDGSPYIVYYHDDLKRHIEEYYKWLLIVSNKELAPNGANDVSPPSYIDYLWHKHILDTKNYTEVCKEIAGDIIDHYPENSFGVLSDKRRERLQNTEKIYEIMFPINNNIPNEEYEKIFDIWLFNYDRNKGYIKQFIDKLDEPNIFIFVIDLSGKINLIFNIKLGISVNMFKKMIEEKTGIPPPQMRLIFAGKLLYDDNKTLKDYGIKKENSLHLILSPRGC